jgi:hypothetical protein
MENDHSDKPSPAQKAERGAVEKEDWIGSNLRKVYDEVLNEPIPDRFLSLLKEIERKEHGS